MNNKSGKTNPIAWVPTVYFAMGLPFVALNLVSVIMFNNLGVDKTEIAFWTSLLTLPYTLKFLWSPLLEIYWTKKNFVVTTQALSGFCFALIAFVLPLPDFFSWSVAIMGMIALSGATHDIATDGIYLTALDKKTQSTYIGWQGAFYNLAKVLANGGLVWLAGMLMNHYKAENPERAPFYAWMIIMGLLGVLLIALAVYHFFVLPKGSRESNAPRSGREAMTQLWEVLADFFRKPGIWIYILFIVCYRLTEGFAIKMVPIFLQAPHSEGGLAMTNEQMGTIYGIFGTVAFIVGSILGGYYIARLTLRRALFSLVCIFNVPFIIYFLFSEFLPESLWVIGAGLVTEYFCYGFGFVGLTLFMMQQVAPGKHSMAHYAFASAIMNLGVMLPGMASGWLCEQMGYSHFFLFALFTAIPTFILVKLLPFHHSEDETVDE
ncbi:MAG: MFS transporter [Muribaculaceae bacterium]|nr:MFS transporter [Muribaculaceae bacterium]MDE6118753.1 MFS transporter [Muribaculaceae bacterium]MDE6316177.1 MFS transporter [Muribaculaceae bacterium]